jgi:hypothetical protein
MGLQDRKQLFLVHYIVSQQEINVCSTAFRYQLPYIWPPSFNRPAVLQKGQIQQVKGGIIHLILRNHLVD